LASKLSTRLAIATPCIFTIGRLACALVVIVWTFDGLQRHDAAAFDATTALIAVAIVFDVLDGLTARLLGAASSFGLHLDSLADIVAFGLAPAALGFAWGVQPIRAAVSDVSGTLFVAAAWCAFTLYLWCATFRLARFNLDTSTPSAGERAFVGLPVPAAAAVIAAVVHFAKQPLTDLPQGVAWLVLVTLLGVLMASRIRYDVVEPYPKALRTWLFRVPAAAMIVWALWMRSDVTVLVGVAICTSSGPLRDVLSRLSARQESST
jgi:CDP-diacylglycerol--serine O-phosphatidyltransferase